MMNLHAMKAMTGGAGALLLGLAGLLCQAGAMAQSSVMIWPLDPVIEEDQRASALWLENRGAQSVSLQVRVLGWSQNGREESYDAQDVVVASPPVAVIPPGARQLVRLMNTRPAPDGKELAFRVLVDELPGSDAAADSASGNAQGSSMGIKLQIRYSVPLFVSGKGIWTKARADRKRDPATAAQPELSWRIDREPDGVFLVVRNTGAAHARLTAAQWARGNDTTTINPGLLGYVLAGAEMRWRLESQPPMGFSPQARVNGGDLPVRFATQ